ncbi:MAG: hypothetical protein AAF414_16595 [Pseudomonadota bacterium]
MRFTLAPLAALLAGWSFLASAQDWQPVERLIVPIPDNWAPVGTEELPSGPLTVYRSALEPGSDQIGVQRFVGIVDQAPEDIASRMLDGLPDTCVQQDAELSTPTARNQRPLAIVSVICAPQGQDGSTAPDIIEVSRALVLAGNEDLHMVTRVWRGELGAADDPIVGGDAGSAWSRFFDSIDYCPATGC